MQIHVLALVYWNDTTLTLPDDLAMAPPPYVRIGLQAVGRWEAVHSRLCFVTDIP